MIIFSAFLLQYKIYNIFLYKIYRIIYNKNKIIMNNTMQFLNLTYKDIAIH